MESKKSIRNIATLPIVGSTFFSPTGTTKQKKRRKEKITARVNRGLVDEASAGGTGIGDVVFR